MVQEYAVHGLADGVVATEGERQVADAAAHVHLGHLLMYGAAGPDEGFSIVVMLRHTRGDGKHVGVDDDVFRWETYVLQQLIRPASHRHLAFVGVGLTLFVKEHHHRGGSHRRYVARLAQEWLLAFLQRDRVDDGLALHVLQSGLDDIPP